MSNAALSINHGRPATMTITMPAPTNTAEVQNIINDTNRTLANVRATLFRLDPTPERLTAWADTYALLPDGEGE